MLWELTVSSFFLWDYRRVWYVLVNPWNMFFGQNLNFLKSEKKAKENKFDGRSCFWTCLLVSVGVQGRIYNEAEYVVFIFVFFSIQRCYFIATITSLIRFGNGISDISETSEIKI